MASSGVSHRSRNSAAKFGQHSTNQRPLNEPRVAGSRTRNCGSIIISISLFLLVIALYASKTFWSFQVPLPRRIAIPNLPSIPFKFPTANPYPASPQVHQALIALEERVRVIESKLFHSTRGGIARQDFAFRRAGAHVLDNLTTLVPASNEGNLPYLALDDDNRFGKCWRVSQDSAQLGIRLSQPIKITHFSIDHIPGELVPDLLHAPRDIILWGLLDTPPSSLQEDNQLWALLPRRTPPIIIDDKTALPLAFVRYDIASPDFIQTFSLLRPDLTSPFIHYTFSGVVVDILNNWGAEFICLYHVRIHGEIDQ